jgi:hypothetical protein
MKEAQFRQRTAAGQTAGSKHPPNQAPAGGRFAVAQKFVNDQSERFPLCLLSYFRDFISVPAMHKFLYPSTDNDPFLYPC